MNDFNLEFLESTLKLMDYERIKPIANDLLRRGYAVERIAALMFRYGWTSGRKAMKESQAFRRQAYNERRQQRNTNTISHTSGVNEGSV